MENSDAPCFAAWQIAHGSNHWDSIAKGWPDLRAGFRERAATYWPAFASGNGRPPLDQTADALGAARIAYRLRDMDTYLVAAHSFARSLVQLSAQQRGLNYFREHQPWRSMEPIDSTAALTLMDQTGMEDWNRHYRGGCC